MPLMTESTSDRILESVDAVYRSESRRILATLIPLMGELMTISGVGQNVSFIDTEGNRVSMLQPLPRG